MTAPRNLRAASQPLKQTVDAARLVAHSILGLYPVPDLSGCLESPARHLLGQLPLLIWAQKPRLAPTCHLVAQHSFHTSLSIPAHPRLYRPVVHSHSCRRLTELPSRPDQPQSMESCTKDNVMFCLVGCLQCRRCILQTPIDSKRSTHHRDAPQHSMLVTAWMNYKYTASYFQVSLSSNGITCPTLHACLSDIKAIVQVSVLFRTSSLPAWPTRRGIRRRPDPVAPFFVSYENLQSGSSSPLWPTQLDKIKNLRVEVHSRAVDLLRCEPLTPPASGWWVGTITIWSS